LSRTLPPRLVLVVMALAMLLGLLAMTAASRSALAQPTTTGGTPGADQATTTVAPADDGRTHQRPDHCPALDGGAHHLRRADDLGTSEQWALDK
jgi:hypothetical protein